MNVLQPKQWMTLYADALYNYTLPRVHDKTIAEDLVQETFLAALKGMEGYKGDSSEKSWLFAILKNKIIDYYRKKCRERAEEWPEERIADTDDWFDSDGNWLHQKRPKDWGAIENYAERREIQKIIDACKQHLKILQQQVFVMKYMEDLNAEEICTLLKISNANYWVLLHRARLQMRDCVEKNLI